MSFEESYFPAVPSRPTRTYVHPVPSLSSRHGGSHLSGPVTMEISRFLNVVLARHLTIIWKCPSCLAARDHHRRFRMGRIGPDLVSSCTRGGTPVRVDGT